MSLVPISDISCFYCNDFNLVVEVYMNECWYWDNVIRCVSCGEVYYSPVKESRTNN